MRNFVRIKTLKKIIFNCIVSINISYNDLHQACPLSGPRAKCGPRRYPKKYSNILSSRVDPRFFQGGKDFIITDKKIQTARAFSARNEFYCNY